MKIKWLGVYIIVWLLTTASAAGNGGRAQLDSLLSSKFLSHAQVGAVAKYLRADTTLFEKNGSKLFIPASNNKIFTSLAALKLLGTNYKYETEFYLDDSNNFYIRGQGDPLLKVSHLRWAVAKVALTLKDSVNHIIGIEDYFQGPSRGKGWMWDEGPYPFNARISPLSVNYNIVSVLLRSETEACGSIRARIYPKSDFVTIRNKAKTIAGNVGDSGLVVKREYNDSAGINCVYLDGCLPRKTEIQTVYRNIEKPKLFVLSLLESLLEDEGISVEGKMKLLQEVDTAGLTLIHTHRSLALSEIVRRMNKYSSNFIAEQLLKTVAAESTDTSGTFDVGLRLLRDFLRDSVGIEGEFRIKDGSGLSRYNLVQPEQIVKALEYGVENFEISPEFLSALPIAGVDGTLKDMELDDSIRRGRLRAKTGSMNGITCLSGIMKADSQRLIVFSLLINHYTGSYNRLEAFRKKFCEFLYRSF